MFYSLYFLVFLLVLIVLFFLMFYRDPERIPPEGNLILAPADGKIISIAREETWIKIAISLRLFDVHTQWVPYPGKVVSVEKINRSSLIKLETPIGRIVIRQMTGIFARRIKTFVQEGDRVIVGQRFGKILLGSRVELWLPQDKVDMIVDLRDKVFAGRTPLAIPRI